MTLNGKTTVAVMQPAQIKYRFTILKNTILTTFRKTIPLFPEIRTYRTNVNVVSGMKNQTLPIWTRTMNTSLILRNTEFIVKIAMSATLPIAKYFVNQSGFEKSTFSFSYLVLSVKY